MTTNKFNWQMATIAELAQHILSLSDTNSIRQQVNHYKKNNNIAMLEKIALAQKIVKLDTLREEVKRLEKELFK